MRGTLARTDLIGAEAIQVFVANPRGWAEPPPDPDGDAAFARARADRGLAVFVHAPYLINFGSPSPDTLRRSRDALAFSLRRAAAIGAAAVVVHAGSAVLGNQWTDAMAQVRTNLIPLLDVVGGAGPQLLIEPTAGGGGALASDIASIGAYLDVLDDDRIGLCIDTCHLHAAGHDLSTAAGMRSAFTRLRRTVGAGRIRLAARERQPRPGWIEARPARGTRAGHDRARRVRRPAAHPGAARRRLRRRDRRWRARRRHRDAQGATRRRRRSFPTGQIIDIGALGARTAATAANRHGMSGCVAVRAPVNTRMMDQFSVRADR